MRYLSVCSGIEAASAAWHPLGWEAAAFAEIDAFPSAVLTHHYPSVPNHGDFTTIQEDHYGAIALLVGGTPCQDFSIAGLRAGMDGARGALTIQFARLAERLRPRWLVWENVPGVLSIDNGRAFGAFLGSLGQFGYGIAYRVLDAQHFGVPQRRRRVFVVGHLGDWRRAAAVLFERHGLSGYFAPSREARQGFAAGAARSVAIRGRDGTPQAELGDDKANADRASEESLLVTHSLRADGFDASEDGTGRGTPLVAILEQNTQASTPALPSMRAHATPNYAVAISANQRGEVREREVHGSLNGSRSGKQFDGICASMAVRRLTPLECERLQGFLDGYTAIPYRGKMAADGPRYKALGNSMAVPVMSWIGRRIAAVDNLRKDHP